MATVARVMVTAMRLLGEQQHKVMVAATTVVSDNKGDCNGNEGSGNK
jgi:hypothetical protein